MEILRDIKNRDYQCLICHEDITPETKVWSCDVCSRVFDLKCTLDWSARKQNQGLEWKCPHCSAITTGKPRYRCWCKKVKSPDCDYDRPHSCGQTCGAKRKCPHPCTELCHPGNHPPCTAIGLPVKCFCGKQKKQDVCVKTNYQGFSCTEVCGKSLACKKHKCQLTCHEGQCPPCTKKTTARCYCGQSQAKIGCGQGKREKFRNFHGLYACDQVCSKPLNCGNHKCSLPCHPLTGHKHVCDKQPHPRETCNCGKTVLSYYGLSRTSCTDPIPSCNRPCDKVMDCGHECQLKCHEGPCTCTLSVLKTCKCGSTRKQVSCNEQIPDCNKKCSAPMSCGRHKCQRLCCEFSSGKNRIKKSMSLEDFFQATTSQMSDDELAVHLCTAPCNRTLGCGRHVCEAVCHPGQCRRCMQAVHEDYECPCGRTRMLAPIPCGTSVPECKHQCRVVQPGCGHSGTHKCHDTHFPCPPCTAIVAKQCVCGKQSVSRRCDSTQPPRCVFSCGRELECGHPCPVVCHDGPCPPCTSRCNRPLGCLHNHLHAADCHGTTDCGECQQVMTATCKCGGLKMEYECGEELEIFCNEACINTEPAYHPLVCSIYEDRPGWCRKIETELREFMNTSKQAYGFKPMRKSDRRFVHYLAEHYGLVGVSVDQGPNRSVRVNRSTNSWVPRHTIERSIRLARLNAEYLPKPLIDEDAMEDVGFSD